LEFNGRGANAPLFSIVLRLLRSVEDKRPSPPKVKGYDQAYELSYSLACETLRANADLNTQCRRAGAECQVSGPRATILLQYLGNTHVITLPEITVVMASSPQPVALRDKLLMLHYFNTAKGTPPTGRPVTFRELPAGPVYFPTYTKRAIRPIVDAFAKEPARLVAAAQKMGGSKGEMGDASVVITAFPHVAITYVLWSGDEELPPQGNILDDANVSDYLPTEDITVLTESITWRLVRSQG
jgi:Domain of unknown function (DUF3786)